MPVFKILGEAKVLEDISVEADSYEEAVIKFEKMKISVHGVLEPVWIATGDHLESTGEYEYKIESHCSWCKIPFVDRDIAGQPWKYAIDPKSEHNGLVCYPCLKKEGFLTEDGLRVKDEE